MQESAIFFERNKLENPLGDFFKLDLLVAQRKADAYAIQLINQAYLLDKTRFCFVPIRSCSILSLFDDYQCALDFAFKYLIKLHNLLQNDNSQLIKIISNTNKSSPEKHINFAVNYKTTIKISDFIAKHLEQMVIVPVSYDFDLQRANLILGVVKDLSDWEILAVH